MSEASESAQRDRRAENDATRLILLATSDQSLRLWHSPEGKAYATLKVEDHHENHPIQGRKFLEKLKALFFKDRKRVPNRLAVGEAAEHLDYLACSQGGTFTPHVRVAEAEHRIFLDLGRSDWNCVEITDCGWRIVRSEEAPIKFIRPSHMGMLPIPERGGSTDKLRSLLNPGLSDSHWKLIVGFLLSTLRPHGPFTILAVHGEHGSAKSTGCRLLRDLIDPNAASLRSLPRNEESLMISAANSWILAFDNLSFISRDSSDALCRLATGGGLSRRTLYEDQAETVFSAKRPVILNGIEDVARRADLLDRCLLVELPTIPGEFRRTEVEVLQEFRAIHAHVLGSLLDAAVVALRQIDKTSLNPAPRMADFARWVSAGESALQWSSGAFAQAYRENIEAAHLTAVSASFVGEQVREFASDMESWTGTATELLHHLTMRVSQEVSRQRQWPKQPHRLSGELKRLAPALRQLGVDVRFFRVGASGDRMIKIISQRETKRQERQQRQSDDPGLLRPDAPDTTDARSAALEIRDEATEVFEW